MLSVRRWPADRPRIAASITGAIVALWRIAHRRQDRAVGIFPLQLGIGTKVVFWQPVILTVDERAIIPFLDPRRAKRLTAQDSSYSSRGRASYRRGFKKPKGLRDKFSLDEHRWRRF